MGLRTALAAGLLGLVACSSGSSSSGTHSAAKNSDVPSATAMTQSSPTGEAVSPQQVPGGCGFTRVYKGIQPEWLRASLPSGVGSLPWAEAQPNIAAAVLWTSVLHGREWPSGTGDKVMWAVRSNHGPQLLITARRAGSTDSELTLRTNVASPGLIYTSDIALPKPGCWHLSLAWETNRAAIELQASG
jgi:hypothetical protein